MSQRVVQYGKVMLFLSFALVAGLFISQRMLEAHDTDEPVLSIDQLAEQNALQYVDGDELREKLEEKIRRADQDKELIALNSREGKLFIQGSGRKGRPVALLAAGKICEINPGAVARGYRKTPYPSRDLLQELHKRGARVTVSSDAHTAGEIAFGFAEAERLAHECGFTEYWIYDGSAFAPVPFGGA